MREDTTPKYLLRTGAYFNGTARSLTGTRVIPNKTLTWAVATYDGAQLKTYIANGDGSNLVLDSSKEQTGTVATGAAITGIDEDLVVGAKHRKGHWVDGTGGEIAEGFFNGTMSRFIVYNTAFTQSEISSVISGSVPSGKPGPVQAHFIQKSIMSSGANPTVPYKVSWTQGTCPSGSTYNVTLSTGGSPTVVYSGTALSAKIHLAVGVGYTIAVDCGAGSSTTSLTLTGYQEGAASYTGIWRNSSVSGAWGGVVRYTTAASPVRDVPLRVVPGDRLGSPPGLSAWFGEGVRRRHAEDDREHTIVGGAEPRDRLSGRVGDVADGRRPYA